MNKHSYRIICILFTTSLLYAQDQYWKNNPHTPWYSAVYRSILGPSLEDRIPELLTEYDQQTMLNPTHLIASQSSCTDIFICGKRFSLDQVCTKIECGPTYDALQIILNSNPLFAKYPLQLAQGASNVFAMTCAQPWHIILHDGYAMLPDAIKLFILHHEVQHHLYNDLAHKHLEAIINISTQNPTLQEQLQTQRQTLQHHIIRYIEYRADRQAILAMQCPYCLQEVALYCEIYQGKYPAGTYNQCGYAYAWQFEPRINELTTEKKCCEHHKNTNNAIDLATTNEITLQYRLNITQG